MARVKLRWIMGYPGLKSSCREKGLLRSLWTKIYERCETIHTDSAWRSFLTFTLKKFYAMVNYFKEKECTNTTDSGYITLPSGHSVRSLKQQVFMHSFNFILLVHIFFEFVFQNHFLHRYFFPSYSTFVGATL